MKRSYRGVGWGGKERVKMDIRFAGGRAIPVGPENVFVGPPCRNFSRAHSVRIDFFLLANGSTAEERYWVNGARC